MRDEKCRTCGTPVVWRRTANEKWTPEEHDGTPHWARCPQARAWKGRARREEQGTLPLYIPRPPNVSG